MCTLLWKHPLFVFTFSLFLWRLSTYTKVMQTHVNDIFECCFNEVMWHDLKMFNCVQHAYTTQSIYTDYTYGDMWRCVLRRVQQHRRISRSREKTFPHVISSSQIHTLVFRILKQNFCSHTLQAFLLPTRRRRHTQLYIYISVFLSVRAASEHCSHFTIMYIGDVAASEVCQRSNNLNIFNSNRK